MKHCMGIDAIFEKQKDGKERSTSGHASKG
jgi:hypothetical protein